jgi:glycosyltransferase involved in cell wall biosynthesis
MSEEKSPLAFVELATELRGDGQFRFVMTGAGPQEREVRRQIARRGLEGTLDYLGVVPDISAHLTTLDVLVVPSRLDGRPVVVLEAQARGIAVVASKVGSLPRMIEHGTTGFLCVPDDLDDFALRLRWLAGNRQMLASMGDAARKHAEEHSSVDRMHESFAGVFHKLADGRRTMADTATDVVSGTAGSGHRRRV